MANINTISKFIIKDYRNVLGTINILFEKDSRFFYIEEDFEKVEDINKMPTYIKDDWYNYNKKELTLDVINSHILFSKDLEDDDLFKVLVAIRRDFIIDKL
jgi:hypothetical protein